MYVYGKKINSMVALYQIMVQILCISMECHITTNHVKKALKCVFVQGIIFLVSHRNLLCIFNTIAIQNIFCVAVFFHRSVHNFIWNIYPSAEIANQIWGGKLFPVVCLFVLGVFFLGGGEGGGDNKWRKDKHPCPCQLCYSNTASDWKNINFSFNVTCRSRSKGQLSLWNMDLQWNS